MIGTRHPWLVGQRTGTDVAIEACDITLERGDLRAAAEAIRLSRRAPRTIKGNLFWAFPDNVAACPGSSRIAQLDARRNCNGIQLSVGRQQQPATATVPSAVGQPTTAG